MLHCLSCKILCAINQLCNIPQFFRSNTTDALIVLILIIYTLHTQPFIRPYVIYILHTGVKHLFYWSNCQKDKELTAFVSCLMSQDAFVELYGESRPPVSSWSLRTVVGLAVLGAVGVTLGALFAQR